MKKDIFLRNAVCLPFCAHYKPRKNEGLACRGYRVVERLLKSGRSLPFEAAAGYRERREDESMVKAMCHACDFQKDGCGFILDRNAQPCGGFVLLARLLAAGALTIEDIS